MMIQSYAFDFIITTCIEKITERTYATNSNNYVEHVTDYKYKSNTDRLLIEKKVTQSDGSELVNKYTHPVRLCTQLPPMTRWLQKICCVM